MQSIFSFFRDNSIFYFVVATWLLIGVARAHVLKNNIISQNEESFDIVLPRVEGACVERQFVECLNLETPSIARIYPVENIYSGQRTYIINIIPKTTDER